MGAMKLWAGRMNSTRIARAMRDALALALDATDFFDYAAVVHDPNDNDTKVEPFYFDARRGASATALDIGFMPDALAMTTVAYPAVEFLCFVGLQRFRPASPRLRVFEYSAWERPLDARLASVASAGLLDGGHRRAYRFAVRFRTDQRKHKTFTPATPITREEQKWRAPA